MGKLLFTDSIATRSFDCRPLCDQGVPHEPGRRHSIPIFRHKSIKTGVVSGTIALLRVAVLRGSVLPVGRALSGVAISVLNHPEFGQTLSRADGMFDLAVNGGGMLTLNYIRTGYLPVKRQANVHGALYVVAGCRDDATGSDVTVIKLTPNMRMQIARSAISDSDGIRQQTILFPQNTHAVMTLPKRHHPNT